MPDTIFALSSGRPPAAIAVVRISGPQAFAAAATLAGRLPPPRRAALRPLRAGDGRLLDRALVIVFPGPNSVTGEDLVEFHCHGGRAVVAAVEAALGEQPGLRPAVAGEFTRRAVMHGRLDLAEAAGLADLLEAETESQRVAAMDAAEGRVGAHIRSWMDRVSLIAARVEALLDFSDEDDVAQDDEGIGALDLAMRVLADDIDATLAAPSVERLRDGFRVVLAGPPNAGKSTLLNAMVAREAAIVSPIAGTTRDRIEAQVVRAGVAYILTDTAGLTVSDDPVEAIGVERAKAAMATADLVVWLGDTAPPGGALWVHARADLAGRDTVPEGRAIAVSGLSERSVDHLWTMIANRLAWAVPKRDLLVLHDVQRASCARAVDALRASHGGDPLVMAERLRSAAGALGGILGVGATEMMLDALFGRFCIGK